MNGVFAIVLVLCTAAACGDDARGRLEILTYNVAGLPESISKSTPEVNTPLISPRLNAYDLVLVQEDFAYHRLLIRDLEHPYKSEPGPALSLVNDGLNRFSHSSFGPLTRERWNDCFGGIDTSDNGSGDCLASKGFSVATHELVPGAEVDVYNLHAEAGKTERDQQLQGEDFQQLRDYIVANAGDRALIVAGDTNLKPERDAEDVVILNDFLAATGLSDSCHALACGEEHIDRVMFRPGKGVRLEALEWHFERDGFLDDAGEPLSDHDPIAVTLWWRRR